MYTHTYFSTKMFSGHTADTCLIPGSLSSNVYSSRLRSFLTACRKEITVGLPLAERKAKRAVPYRLPALTV